MEKQLFNYDETDIQSILDYSQYLLDRSLGRDYCGIPSFTL